MTSLLDSFAYSLARIRWDVFGTLTFKSVPSSERKAFGLAWAHMHHAAKLVGRPYSKLLIALRPELGELYGRFHFHYLLGGTWCRNEITLSHQLEHHWFGLRGQGSIAKVRAYNPSLAGVEYVTKALSGYYVLGMNEYETRKFNLCESVTVSRSVVGVISDLDRMGRQHVDTATPARKQPTDEASKRQADLQALKLKAADRLGRAAQRLDTIRHGLRDECPRYAAERSCSSAKR